MARTSSILSKLSKLALICLAFLGLFMGIVFAELNYVEGSLYESSFESRDETKSWMFVRSEEIPKERIPAAYMTAQTIDALQSQGSYVMEYSAIWSSFVVVFDLNDRALLRIPTGL